jgi:hypothetical protein
MGLPRDLGSVNDEMRLGMTEGRYKSVVQNRGGVVETLTYDSRRDLSVSLYGIVELADKELPCGMGTYRSPYAVVTPDPGTQVTHQSSS